MRTYKNASEHTRTSEYVFSNLKESQKKTHKNVSEHSKTVDYASEPSGTIQNHLKNPLELFRTSQ